MCIRDSIEGVLGLFAKYWRRIISPIVAAVVVTAIGFSLLGVGATSFGGGSGAPDFGSPQNLILGTVSLAACLVFQVLAKGKTKQLSVLFGLIVGYVLAVFMGAVDFSGFANVGLFALPQLMPFTPEFNLGAKMWIRDRRWAVSMPVTARATLPTSWVRRRRARSGTCAASTPRPRRWRWAWSTR